MVSYSVKSNHQFYIHIVPGRRWKILRWRWREWTKRSTTGLRSDCKSRRSDRDGVWLFWPSPSVWCRRRGQPCSPALKGMRVGDSDTNPGVLLKGWATRGFSIDWNWAQSGDWRNSAHINSLPFPQLGPGLKSFWIQNLPQGKEMAACLNTMVFLRLLRCLSYSNIYPIE